MTRATVDKNRDGVVWARGRSSDTGNRIACQATGANILAELAGYGATADAFHVTARMKRVRAGGGDEDGA